MEGPHHLAATTASSTKSLSSFGSAKKELRASQSPKENGSP